MKAANVLWMAMFSAMLVIPTSLLAQPTRQVPPRNGQQPAPRQTTQGQLRQVRQVTPRGNNAQARNSGAAAAIAPTPRYVRPRAVRRMWRLGVEFSEAPKGIRIDTVYRGSAAARDIGLETGDYILDVDGVPVGTHNGWHYDLSDLLDQRADARGAVNILIWNFRTKQEEDYWVDLDRR
jgi:hypothetical protein